MTQKRLFHHGLSLVILSSQSIINNKMPAKFQVRGRKDDNEFLKQVQDLIF